MTSSRAARRGPGARGRRSRLDRYDAFDGGSLADSWRFQRDTAAYAGLYVDGDDWGSPVAAGPDRVRDRLAAAGRNRDM